MMIGHSRILFSVLLAGVCLSACVTTSGRPPQIPAGPSQGTETHPISAAPVSQEPVKVAMLLPLSGKHAALGEAMQNAAQMALTDLGYPQFELMFEDTKSNAIEASDAANNAAKSGARMLLGPIFADEARAAKTAAQANALNLVTFSTDTSVAGNNAFMIGILPHDQARAIADFAAVRGLRRVLVIAPRDTYGQIVTKSFIDRAQVRNIGIAGTLSIDVNNPAQIPAQLAAYFPPAGLRDQMAVDGIFMPLPVDAAARLSRMLKTIPGAAEALRLGTGLWDDADLTQNPDLVGAYYAAPTPSARDRFEQLYLRNFGTNPPRLASLGYDATALAIVLGRGGGTNGFSASAISNPSGFTGIDGLFRLRPDGVAERGLAIIQMQPGARIVAVPAPTHFSNRP